jgi:hypothetical protein
MAPIAQILDSWLFCSSVPYMCVTDQKHSAVYFVIHTVDEISQMGTTQGQAQVKGHQV